MVYRRTLTSGILCCALCARKAAGQRPRVYQDPLDQGLIACGSEPSVGGEFQPNPAQYRTQSGVAALDENIGVEQQALNFFFELSNFSGNKDFGKPTFTFYEDGEREIGARALRKAKNSCSIFLGLSLLRKEIDRSGQAWTSVIIGVLAHEWAHAFQYKTELDERLFLWETHADYMAGWYLGAKRAAGTPGLDARTFASALFARGRLGRFSEDAYGSGQQRASAVMAGFNFGLTHTTLSRRPDVGEAAQEGYKVVSAMIRSAS